MERQSQEQKHKNIVKLSPKYERKHPETHDFKQCEIK